MLHQEMLRFGNKEEGVYKWQDALMVWFCKYLIIVLVSMSLRFAFAEELPKKISFEVPIPLKAQAAEASSTQMAAADKKEDFYPKNAIDGNPSTRWSSEFQEPQWLMLDLDSICDVNKVAIAWESAYAISYKIELSVDGEIWNGVYSTETGDGKIDIITFPLQEARYIKIGCLKRKTGWGFSIWDVTVYGKRKLVLF